MFGLLDTIFNNAQSFEEFTQTSEKQGFTVKPEFRPIFVRLKNPEIIETYQKRVEEEIERIIAYCT